MATTWCCTSNANLSIEKYDLNAPRHLLSFQLQIFAANATRSRTLWTDIFNPYSYIQIQVMEPLMNNMQWLDEVKFNEQGLIPAIAQHHQSGRVLMVA